MRKLLLRTVAPPLLRYGFFPAIQCVSKTRFWSFYRQAQRLDRVDSADRDRLRRERLGRLLEIATRSSLHRRRLDEAELDPTSAGPFDPLEVLRRLMPVTKRDLREEFPDGVTTADEPDNWRYQSTAGTTDRMTVVSDFVKRDHTRSAELRALRVATARDVAIETVDIPPNACNVVCGLADTGPQTLRGYFWHSVRQRKLFKAETISELRGRFERRVVLPKDTFLPIDPMPRAQLTEVLDDYLDQIDQRRPEMLRGFPTYLLWLADRAKETGRRIEGLRYIAPFGGLTSPRMIDRIETGFGAPFFNVYGTSELGSIAASCGQGAGMHLFEDLFVVEPFGDDGPTEDGAVGRLIITDLINTAMPIIRYDVGDLGRLHVSPCPCGRTTARLEVLGRVQEALHAPGGLLSPSEVADVFFEDPEVANFRLEETKPGSFDLAVVARSSDVKPDLESCKERFAALHGGVERIRARLVPFVRPEKSGKYRFVFPHRGSEVLV